MRNIILLFPLLFGLSGCIHETPVTQSFSVQCHRMRNQYNWFNEKALSLLCIGLEKDQVMEKISEPDAIRGATINAAGRVTEVWEYRVNFFKSYFLYFVDNKLIQWGSAGDWQKPADQTTEIRFR